MNDGYLYIMPSEVVVCVSVVEGSSGALIQIKKYKEADSVWYDHTIKKLDRIIKIKKILSYASN